MKNMFEIATREKYRYQHGGVIGTEDLYDLSLESLDQIFKKLNKKLRESEEEGLLEEKSKSDTKIENKIEIIKYIVKYKKDRINAVEQSIVLRQEEQELIELLNKKNKASREEMTEEEINARLAEIKAQR